MICWISPENLDQHVARLVRRVSEAAATAQARRTRNVVDPFSSLVVASTFSIQEHRELENVQKIESTLRGLSNALGEFHQNVLGSVQGWRNHDSGYDLECTSERAIAEVKNKHNTMNAANRREVEQELRTAVRQKRGDWRAFLVQVIPRTPTRYCNDLGGNLFEVDGASFYALATGEDDALHDLFDQLAERLSPNDDIAVHCKRVFARSMPPRNRQSLSLHSTHSTH